MCGIIGAYGHNIDTLDTDLNILRHRGPDGVDAVHIGQHSLGHTRLAIIDVLDGQQPLSNHYETVWLICNGEIYNHRDIRAATPDYPYKTESDSEVILALYQRYGVDAVNHLDGMFAFALMDEREGLLYMARDPLGIKPLYYGWRGETMFFGSEIKAVQDKADTLHEFLPGHWYSNKHGMHQYLDLKTMGRDRDPDAPPPGLLDIRDSLTRAVRKRLMSEVPLGVYLSGGLDSTIVASLVARDMPDVHSFAVGIDGSQDLENARIAAKQIGTQHHEYIYTIDEMLHALPEIIYYLESFDPSLVRSAIPNYFLARMTREYVTVVLTGEGADELYAGYHYLKNLQRDETLHDELVTLTGTLYNCNLQRCDRMTMAHSIEGRVPFLDTDFIETSFAVPIEQKIYGEKNIEKWALRKAFEDIVPHNVAWRVKQQFSEGAGSSSLIEQLADEQINDDEFTPERKAIRQETGQDISSKEMLMYYREFDNVFNTSAKSLVKVWRGWGQPRLN
jgi:asparagine synthase (glutamine-hydrolysing)